MQRLQEENAQLRSQVEKQCKQIIEMAETLQSRLPALFDAANDAAADNGSFKDSKRSGHDAAACFAVRMPPLAQGDSNIDVQPSSAALEALIAPK